MFRTSLKFVLDGTLWELIFSSVPRNCSTTATLHGSTPEFMIISFNFFEKVMLITFF
jgi:hypothetical protein